MKISGSELGAVIRKIVREEIINILPDLMSRVLADKLTKGSQKPQRQDGLGHLANYQRPVHKANKLAEILAQGDEDHWEEEDAPTALSNSQDGIYEKSPLIKGDGSGLDESKRRALLAKVMGENMVDLFEGTKPSPDSTVITGESQQTFGDEGVPLEALGKIGVKLGNLKQTAMAPAPTLMSESDNAKTRQLEIRRKMLDVPVSQWNGK